MDGPSTLFHIGLFGFGQLGNPLIGGTAEEDLPPQLMDAGVRVGIVLVEVDLAYPVADG